MTECAQPIGLLSVPLKRIFAPRFTAFFQQTNLYPLNANLLIRDVNLEPENLVNEALSHTRALSLPTWAGLNDTARITDVQRFRGIVLYGCGLSKTIVDDFVTQHPETPLMLGIETIEAFQRMQELVLAAKKGNLEAVILGASYLTDDKDLYSRVDQRQFQALLRSSILFLHKHQVKAITTGSSCSYDPNMKGDKRTAYTEAGAQFAIFSANTDGGIMQYYYQMPVAAELFKRKLSE